MYHLVHPFTFTFSFKIGTTPPDHTGWARTGSMDSLGLTEAWLTGQRWPEEHLSFNLRLALNSERAASEPLVLCK